MREFGKGIKPVEGIVVISQGQAKFSDGRGQHMNRLSVEMAHQFHHTDLRTIIDPESVRTHCLRLPDLVQENMKGEI